MVIIAPWNRVSSTIKIHSILVWGSLVARAGLGKASEVLLHMLQQCRALPHDRCLWHDFDPVLQDQGVEVVRGALNPLSGDAVLLQSIADQFIRAQMLRLAG